MRSIRRKLLTSFLIIILGLIISSVFSFVIQYSLTQRYEEIITNMILEYHLSEVTTDLIQSYNILSKNISNHESLDKYNSAHKEIGSIIQQLDKSVTSEDSRISYQGIKNIVVSIENELDTGISEVTNGNISNISLHYDTANSKNFFITENTATLFLNDIKYTEQLNKEITKAKIVTEIIGIAILIVGAVISIFYSISFSNRISSPLINLSKLAKVVSSGNFESSVDKNLLSGTDEIGSLANSFNIMILALKDNFSKLKDSNNELTFAKQEIDKKLIEVEKADAKSQEAKSAMINLLEDEKILEQDLKNERDRLSGIITLMGEGLLVVDRNGKILLINTAAQELFETTQSEATGRLWVDIADAYKDDKKIPLEERVFYKVLRSNQPITTGIVDNHYYMTKSGKKFPVTSITTPLSGIGAIKVFRDATLEKEQRAIIEKTVVERTHELQEKNASLLEAQHQISVGWIQLQQEKARLTASINSMSLGFAITDKEENIITVNPAFTQITQIKENLTKFEGLENLFKNISKIDIHQAHKVSKEEKRVVEFKDVSFQTKFLHLFISPIFVHGVTDEYIGSVFLVEDDTERKILDRSRDEFFSIASHELRTPLTAIRGNTALIQQFYSDKMPDTEFKGMISDIHESSQRLITIVNDFLDVSRLEQGRMQFNKESFDLNKIASEVVNELKALASQKNIELKFNSENQNPNVYADSIKVKQILLNLVGNAIKYTDNGQITIEISKDQNSAKIEITDSGRGIPQAQQSLLFHKFQQAGESLFTRDTTKGTGLGLYISKLMVEGMGGHIWLERSEEGKGSTFAFSLPIAA